MGEKNSTDCTRVYKIYGGATKKYRFDIQGSHLFFFTVLVLLGNYEHPCIVTIQIMSHEIKPMGRLETNQCS